MAPNERGWHAIAVVIPLYILAITAVVLRFVARAKRSFPYGPDDWVALLALFFLTCMFVPWILYAAIAQEGAHINTFTPSELLVNLKFLFVLQLTYTFTCPTVKISIVLFYQRVFATRRFYWVANGVITACVCWFIAIFFLDIFQCHPVEYQWDKSKDGHCLNDRTSFVSNSVFNVAIDFTIFFMPMPMIWKLHRSWKDKAALMAIFAVGGFVCVAGIIRAVALSTFGEQDVTYTITSGATWSFIEPSVGLVCGALPTMRVLLPPGFFSMPKKVFSKRPTGYRSGGYSSQPDQGKTPQSWREDQDDLVHSEGRGDYAARAEGGTDVEMAPMGHHEEEPSGTINVQKEVIIT